MKKFTIAFTLFLLSLYSVAQKKRANNWFFGSNAGISFATGTPSVINGSQLSSPEASAVMSDTSGALLFYTDGNTVWNKNHAIMPNGTGLLGGNSSTQGALIVPKPDSDSLYYLFTLDEIGGPNGLQYSVVDMALQGGLGNVTAAKNVTLSANMTEKLTAVKDPNSKRYWIAAHEWGNNVFELYPLTTNGLQPVITQSIGMAHSTSSIQNTYGQMKFSTCGNKIGYAAGYLNTVEIFDFNTTTGAMSNPITLTFAYHVYGFEFSASGNFIYITTYDPNGTLLQYDISSGIQSTIIGTGQILSVNDLRQLQLANNGKVYVCQSFDSYLGEISNPDLAWPACNYQDNAVNVDPNFNGYMTNLGLPNFVTSFMQQPQYTCAVTSTVVTGISHSVTKESINIFPNPSGNEFNFIANEKTLVKVYSVTGLLADQLSCIEGERITFGKNYGKGIYLLRVETAKGTHTVKVIKE